MRLADLVGAALSVPKEQFSDRSVERKVDLIYYSTGLFESRLTLTQD